MGSCEQLSAERSSSYLHQLLIENIKTALCTSGCICAFSSRTLDMKLCRVTLSSNQKKKSVTLPKHYKIKVLPNLSNF